MSRPDYVISALDKETQEKAVIGAGWINDDGAIGIKFNPFIDNIPHGERYAVSLFPNDREESWESRRRRDRDGPRSDHRRAGRRRS